MALNVEDDLPPPLIDEPESVIDYQAKNGEVLSFDISTSACSKHGFFFGSRVETPRGAAHVIGVREGCLWFHIDGDSGASFWDNATNFDQLSSLGIRVSPPEEEPEMKQGEYRIKKINTKKGEMNIVMQNENGPCPLIALCNVLALRAEIKVDGGKYDRISCESMIQLVGSLLMHKYPHLSSSPSLFDETIQSLPVLQFGMDVNFNFTRCDNFENCKNMKIFQQLGIRMVHGWIVDPQSEAEKVIGNYSYNDLTLQLATLNEKKDKMRLPPASPSPSSNSNSQNTNSPNKHSEKEEATRILNEEEGMILEQYLEQTCQQLTPFGLQKLKETLQENELAIFFRNNHFSTLVKHGNQLFSLVTDIGYEKESQIVWELLSLDGNSIFYSGTFFSLEELKQQEVIRNTATEFGFVQSDIEDAIRECQKTGKELQVDDVLLWLSQHVDPPL